MSILCPSLNFFTKRNDKAEKKAREKREEIYIYIHCNISACRIAMIMNSFTSLHLP